MGNDMTLTYITYRLSPWPCGLALPNPLPQGRDYKHPEDYYCTRVFLQYIYQSCLLKMLLLSYLLLTNLSEAILNLSNLQLMSSICTSYSMHAVLYNVDCVMAAGVQMQCMAHMHFASGLSHDAGSVCLVDIHTKLK